MGDYEEAVDFALELKVIGATSRAAGIDPRRERGSIAMASAKSMAHVTRRHMELSVINRYVPTVFSLDDFELGL